MNLQNQWKRLFIGGAAALAITAGSIWAVDNVYAASPAGLLQQVGIEQMEGFGHRGGPGGPGGRGGHGDFGLRGDQEQYLADALGITVEELETAHTTVRDVLIDQAVADGTITQEQADQIKAGERVRVPGLRMKGNADGDVDRDVLLADALGISVDELDAAKESAREAAIADALANGDITQEQVDAMAAKETLRTYLQDTYGVERPNATMAELIQEAVDAGAITQAQADLLDTLGERMGPGGRGHGGRDGHGRDFSHDGTQRDNSQRPVTPEDTNDNIESAGDSSA